MQIKHLLPSRILTGGDKIYIVDCQDLFCNRRYAMANQPIIERLHDLLGSLSPKMRQVASYIIEHHKEAVFLNATSLARKTGVSETTVTRLAYALDFKGYPEIRQALQEHTKNHMALPRYEPKNAEEYMLGEVAALLLGEQRQLDIWFYLGVAVILGAVLVHPLLVRRAELPCVTSTHSPSPAPTH